MMEIAGRGVCFVGVGKRFFDGIKKSFTHPYTDCRLDPIVSFLTINRMNGNLEDSLATNIPWSAGDTGISIGAHKWASANFFDGMIDEILFYAKALTEGEVKKNHGATGLSVMPSGNKLPTCWGEMKVSR